jgi:cell division protein FtsX
MMVVAVIIAFLRYAIKLSFVRFRKQLEVEKLLGATYAQIKAPFMLQVIVILLVSFALVAVYMGVGFSYLGEYVHEVFEVRLADSILPRQQLLTYILWEITMVVVISLVFASFSLSRMLRKI